MGEFFRDGDSRPVTSGELAMDLRAKGLLTLQKVPILQGTDGAGQYMFLFCSMARVRMLPIRIRLRRISVS